MFFFSFFFLLFSLPFFSGKERRLTLQWLSMAKKVPPDLFGMSGSFLVSYLGPFPFVPGAP